MKFDRQHSIDMECKLWKSIEFTRKYISTENAVNFYYEVFKLYGIHCQFINIPKAPEVVISNAVSLCVSELPE